MKMHGPRYLAYLLRLWQVQERGRFAWRASLEHPRTGERRGFPDLASLLAFLVAETGEPDPGDDAARDAGQSEVCLSENPLGPVSDHAPDPVGVTQSAGL